MEEFNSIEDLAKDIKTKLDSNQNKKKIITLYAFNATGKTRLTNMLIELDNDVEVDNNKKISLCYSAFVEDIFNWDNENYVLNFNPEASWIIKLIVEQGLENNIVDNFKDIINSNDLKIEPFFDFEAGKITFNITSGDDNSSKNIKISKGEESVFIWSIFYTVLESAIEILNDDEDDRTTQIFNDLQYIIIDDPVSSIDDTKLISMTIKLVELIKSYKNNNLKFLITTHHALFYNVLINSFKYEKKSKIFESYSFLKENYMFKLSKQDDSPFSYHLAIKELIKSAINDNNIQKYHFNLLRNLLEKTSNFLGYNNWADCISGNNKEEFIKLLNLYSHSRLSDLEGKYLSSEDKILFQNVFNNFIQEFKFKII